MFFLSAYIEQNFPLRCAEETRKRESRNLKRPTRLSFVLFRNKGRRLHLYRRRSRRTRKTYISRAIFFGKIRSTFVQHRSRMIEMIYELYFFIISCDRPPPPCNTRDRPFRVPLSKARSYFSIADISYVPRNFDFTREIPMSIIHIDIT